MTTATADTDVRAIIAKIEATSLGIEDHGILTAYLHLSYGKNGSQSIGGYSLDRWDATLKTRVGTAYGCEFIRLLLIACGVEKWEDLPGRTVFVLKTPEQDGVGLTGALGIRPLPTEPGEEFLFASIRGMADREDAR